MNNAKRPSGVLHSAFLILHFSFFIRGPGSGFRGLGCGILLAAIYRHSFVASGCNFLFAVCRWRRYGRGAVGPRDRRYPRRHCRPLQGGTLDARRSDAAIRPSESWEGRVSVVAPDGDGVPCRYSTPGEPPCRVAAGQSVPVVLFVRIGRTSGELTVELRQSDALVARKVFKAGAQDAATLFPPALLSTDGLVLVVGPDSLPAAEILRRSAPARRRKSGGRARVSDAAGCPPNGTATKPWTSSCWPPASRESTGP